MANRRSKWTKAWTHLLGVVDYALFLTFRLLARVTRRDERRWLLPVVLGAAGVALLSGLGLAYQQVERQEHASDAAVAPSPGQRSPAPIPSCSPPIRSYGSEADFLEALQRYRELAKHNPAAYKFCVAATLHNLAGFYRARQRFKESEAAYQEALQLNRDLAKGNPAACQICVAATLNNLADLYATTKRFKESEAAYQEALHLYRELAKSNSALYQPNVDAIVTALAALAKVKTVETEPK